MADAKRFPYIEFDAIIDDRTTELCRSLDRAIVPAGHPYLSTYWPPNHFYCRLNVRQLVQGIPTPDDKLPYPAIPANFKNNLAAAGKLLPTDGGYFNDTPSSIISDKQMRWVNPQSFIKEKYTGGGSIEAHERMDKDKSNELLYLGIHLAENYNCKIKMMPEIHNYNKQARKLFYPELPISNPSNPDMRINGVLADLATPETWNSEKLKRLANKFNAQNVEIGLISLKNVNATPETIIKEADGFFSKGAYKSLKEIWIVDRSNTLYKYRRKDI